MQLAHPLSVQLTAEQLAMAGFLAHHGDTLSRSAAIRLLLEQSIRFHRDGILPSTGSLVVK
jgi:hypothetical protein